jgi:hypothetical protein
MRLTDRVNFKKRIVINMDEELEQPFLDEILEEDPSSHKVKSHSINRQASVDSERDRKFGEIFDENMERMSLQDSMASAATPFDRKVTILP